jgi:hypothetical protein
MMSAIIRPTNREPALAWSARGGLLLLFVRMARGSARSLALRWQAPTTPDAHAGRCTMPILIVDDDADIRFLISQLLIEEGYTVA